jgi:hypothetical protein
MVDTRPLRGEEMDQQTRSRLIEIAREIVFKTMESFPKDTDMSEEVYAAKFADIFASVYSRMSDSITDYVALYRTRATLFTS